MQASDGEQETESARTTPTRRPTVAALEAWLGTARPVLDHGFVRVVDYMGDDAAVVQAARVSYGRGTKPGRADVALIRYLMRHRHTTPFEMCEIKYHIKLPIFVARQWIRHRTANVNEISARYSILDREFYVPALENLAAQSTDNRQGRGEPLDPERAAAVLAILRTDAERAHDHYQALLDQGLARELARINLTLATYTQWYWKIDLHNLLHFLSLRLDPHAQCAAADACRRSGARGDERPQRARVGGTDGRTPPGRDAPLLSLVPSWPRTCTLASLEALLMRYVSTRGQAPVRDFADVLLAGLAEDGGLYVPQSWPELAPADWQELAPLPYAELTARILSLFAGESIPLSVLRSLAEQAYAGFDHPAVVPLVQIEHNLFLCELFHGPTLAFKDLALQMLGGLFAHVLHERGSRVGIIGATSGDTGSAAIAACAGRDNIDIVILHPKGRTSEVQRRQMTTVLAANVGNIAVEGSFDDCQDLVKAMFADRPFREALRLSAVNSINWARIAAQVPYYVATALALGAPYREVCFAVPTGNFGNVLAAWVARRMGLPIRRLIIGSNANDILTRFLAANDMSQAAVTPTLSPSMDIQVSSNFERLLFELLGRDGAATAAMMTRFRASGRMAVPDAAWREARALFSGWRCDDQATLAEISRLYAASGYLADPHSAIGVAAARALAPRDVPTVAMATAHPAKFPDAVARACGVRPPLPARLASLFAREERFATAPNDLAAVEALVGAVMTRNAP